MGTQGRIYCLESIKNAIATVINSPRGTLLRKPRMGKRHESIKNAIMTVKKFLGLLFVVLY